MNSRASGDFAIIRAMDQRPSPAADDDFSILLHKYGKLTMGYCGRSFKYPIRRSERFCRHIPTIHCPSRLEGPRPSRSKVHGDWMHTFEFFPWTLLWDIPTRSNNERKKAYLILGRALHTTWPWACTPQRIDFDFWRQQEEEASYLLTNRSFIKSNCISWSTACTNECAIPYLTSTSPRKIYFSS